MLHEEIFSISGSIELDNDLFASFSFGESVTSRYVEIELLDSKFIPDLSKTLNGMNDDVLIHSRNSKILVTYPSRSDATDANRLLKATYANHPKVNTIRLLVVSDFCLLEVQWRSSISLNTALSRLKHGSTLLGKLFFLHFCSMLIILLLNTNKNHK
jgi:hypothetical protein